MEKQSPFFKLILFKDLLAFLIDYFLLSPLAAFAVVILMKKGLDLSLSFPNSVESKIILIQAAGFLFFVFTFFQSIFIYKFSSTPGQILTKTFIQFDHEDMAGLFLQIWLRQVGVVVSVLMLGLPFLAIFYHPTRRAFYDRLSECSVKSLVQNQTTYLPIKEQRYLSSAISVLFISVVFLLFYFKPFSMKKTLTFTKSYTKDFSQKSYCSDLVKIDHGSRLSTALALYMAGVIPEKCLLSEADFELWKDFSTDSIELKALAYFAKSVVQDDSEYLKKVCEFGEKTRVCHLIKSIQQGEEQELYTWLDDRRPFELMLKYKISNSIEDLNKLVDFNSDKGFKKFYVMEQLNLFNFSKSRQPASLEPAAESKQKLIKMVKEL